MSKKKKINQCESQPKFTIIIREKFHDIIVDLIPEKFHWGSCLGKSTQNNTRC